MNPGPFGDGAAGRPEEPPLVYLDHAATAPVRPAVADAMEPFLRGRFGNPSGSHRMARDAKRALEEARDMVAGRCGVSPHGVVFTSGGTEADNLAVQGTLAARNASARGRAAPRANIVTSAVEHPAVAETARALAGDPGRHGPAAGPIEHRSVPVDADGMVDLDALAGSLDDGTLLVSVMAANHELGTIQPLAAVREVVRVNAPAATLHTDAVQAAPWLDLVELTAGYDLVSLSAHKLGGPKGTGALAVGPAVALAGILLGGGQEEERRSGTPDVAGIVGFARALEAVHHERASATERVSELRDRLALGIRRAVPASTPTVTTPRVLPGHLHLLVEGVDQEDLLLLLDQEGVCASAGAACASGALEPSPVLTAVGVPAERARGAIRFTLGPETTAEEVSLAVLAMARSVERLKAGQLAGTG